MLDLEKAHSGSGGYSFWLHIILSPSSTFWEAIPLFFSGAISFHVDWMCCQGLSTSTFAIVTYTPQGQTCSRPPATRSVPSSLLRYALRRSEGVWCRKKVVWGGQISATTAIEAGSKFLR